MLGFAADQRGNYLLIHPVLGFGGLDDRAIFCHEIAAGLGGFSGVHPRVPAFAADLFLGADHRQFWDEDRVGIAEASPNERFLPAVANKPFD